MVLFFFFEDSVGLIYNINRSLLENLKLLSEDKMDEMKNRRTSKISALKKLKNDSSLNLEEKIVEPVILEPAPPKQKEEEEEFVKVSSPDLKLLEEEEEGRRNQDIFKIEIEKAKRSSLSDQFKKLTPRSQSAPPDGSVSPNKSPRKTTRSQTVILQKDTSGFLDKLFSPRSKKNSVVNPVVVVETSKKNLQFNSTVMMEDCISPLSSPRREIPLQKESSAKKSNQILFIPREQSVGDKDTFNLF
jgi:hypothetical protein